MSLSFSGRVAVVTGAAGSLGSSYVRWLARSGARVVANDIAVGPLEELVSELTGVGLEVWPSRVDSADGDSVIADVMQRFGRIDALICNAGTLVDRAFHRMSDADWQAVITSHLLGSMRITRAAWPHMRNAKYGRVVLTGSASGLYGFFGQANYAAAKMGILGLSNALSVEGASHNIRTNVICPLAMSKLSGKIWPPSLRSALSPDKVTPLVALLAHESCPCTGACFEAGGGWIAEVRLQRSRGTVFDVESCDSIERLLERWQEITDYTNAEYPSQVADTYRSAAAGMNADEATRWMQFVEGLGGAKTPGD
ncbi:MAG: SDR family NAD(P)-dependent oxidoreductase [Steroidobacteraceae bacterium]